MGKYIQPTDLYSEFGRRVVREWAQHDKRDGSEDVDEIIAGAIDEAEGMLEDALRGLRYSLPLSPVDYSVKRLLKGWAAKTIFHTKPVTKENRGVANMLSGRTGESDRILQKIQSGEIKLTSGTGYPDATRAPTILTDCGPGGSMTENGDIFFPRY